MEFALSCISCNSEVSLYRVMTFSQFLSREFVDSFFEDSTNPYCASCNAALLFVVVVHRCIHIRDGRPPIPIAEHEFAADVH